MNERPFQRRVEDMATRFGWKWWHVPSPMRAVRAGGFVGAREAAGIADLILTHDDPPRLVFMELKGDGGILSTRQVEFLQAIQHVADDVAATEAAAANEYGGSGDSPVGVYAFWPKHEPQIEQLLRTKVLT